MSSRGKVKQRGGYSVGEQRRIKLIDATIQSLAEFGVAGTTVSTISTASGSSRGLIAHYFDNKEDLLAAALRHLYESVSKPIRQAADKPGLSPLERLRKVPKVMFSKAVYTEQNRSAFLSLWHETRYNSILRQTNQDLYRRYVSYMEGLFRDAAVEKGVHIDAHVAAIGFIGLSDGLWLGMSIHDKLITPRQAVKTCHHFIDRELMGPLCT